MRRVTATALAIAFLLAGIPAVQPGAFCHRSDSPAAMAAAGQSAGVPMLLSRESGSRLPLAAPESVAPGLASGAHLVIDASLPRAAGASLPPASPRPTLVSLGCLMTI
jgi:hypothetical protein